MLEHARATGANLPRLLYLGNLAVDASFAGSALLYRLLQSYPSERLCIAEAGARTSALDLRLRGVRYEDYRPMFARLLRSRFSQHYRSWLILTAAARARQFMALVHDFQPEAVLSVTAGHSFITAASLANKIDVPYHLICHDEWAATMAPYHVLYRHHIFGQVYRMAASRLCVSPFMAQDYEDRYIARARVLYPSRAANALEFSEPPDRLGRTDHAFVCAYAGSFTPAYTAALRRVAQCLASFGGRLLIFGPMDEALARSADLYAPNVELGGLLTSDALIATLRARADALFVPMSFSPGDRANAQIGFPSKLTDSTAVGVPLVVYGPEYCSAVRWAQANAPVAEVITVEGDTELFGALRRLALDPAYRLQLGKAALSAGKRYFSNEVAFDVFSAALSGVTGYRPAY